MEKWGVAGLRGSTYAMSRNLKSTLEILDSQEDLGHGSEWDHDLISFLFLREKNLVTVRKAKRAVRKLLQ